jgi:hypothetical protein
MLRKETRSRYSYGLDSAGIESRWQARFSAHVQTGPGTPVPLSSAEVKEKVELYFYSPCEPS